MKRSGIKEVVKMKIKYKLETIVLLVSLMAAATSTAGAFPSETNACNSPNCHAYPPTMINVTTNITSITVSPGQSFTIGISWSGGGTSNAVKWPSNFNNIGITRDNTLFNPTPILPFQGTDASGTTSSTLTAPAATGSYMVRAYAARGSTATVPKETDFKDIAVTVAAPPTPAGTFNISGFKINNVTGSGVQGWNITVMNATLQKSMLTGADGSYKFTDLVNGTYDVTEEMQAGWTNVSPISQQVTIAGSDMMNINFTNQPPTVATFNISGFKINDTNGNGIWDAGEMGIENWNINLLNDTGVQLANTSTDASGFYQFMNIFPGNYNIAEEMKPGFISTNATSMPVTIENIDVMNVNFTNQVTVPQPQPGTFNISGFKINGTDNNGMGIENWNIMLLNATGAQLASTMTDSTGFYSFTGLTNGTYNVTEGMMAGWTNTSQMFQIVTINGTDVTNVNFTNMLIPPPATFNISGFKINDTNANGVWDAGEMGIENWNIMLLNDMGVQIANTSTDTSGFYEFMSIFPGNYNVTEEMKAGFTPTNVTSKMVTIENMDVTNVNFTNMPVVPTMGSISGFKFNDINGNGIWDPVEPGLANWTIVLTMPDGSTENTNTNSDGFYMFNNLTPGNYNVSEVLQPGWVQTFPPNPIRSITLSAGENVTDVDFGNMLVTVNGNISGFKINAANGMGLQGWTIRLIGIVGKGAGTRVIRMNTTTNADGFYMFNDLPAGRYILREEHQKGFVPVGSPVKHITLTLGENSMNNNFTNRPIRSLVDKEEHKDKEDHKDAKNDRDTEDDRDMK